MWSWLLQSEYRLTRVNSSHQSFPTVVAIQKSGYRFHIRFSYFLMGSTYCLSAGENTRMTLMLCKDYVIIQGWRASSFFCGHRPECEHPHSCRGTFGHNSALRSLESSYSTQRCPGLSMAELAMGGSQWAQRLSSLTFYVYEITAFCF